MQITNFSLPIFVAMFFQFFADYLKHRLTAKSRHGTHSPFVYKLTDEVIYDFSAKKEYDEIEAQRKKLLHDVKNSSNKVLQIAKSTLKPPHLAQLIYRLAANQELNHIIEVNTGFGITTIYLSKAKPAADILTIESNAEVAEIAHQNFIDLGLKNIELQVGNFNELLPKAIDEIEILDLLYVNGRQNKNTVLNYFNWSLRKVHDNSFLIVDDIYGDQDMKDAWTAIKNHPQVTVTIDLFWLGLVYFRKGQAKEHFKIKF